MTPEQQRIAIAETCGWRFDPTTPNQDMKHVAIMCWIRPGNDDWQTEQVPDYLNDLNAMHEAEKVLTPDKKIAYLRHLTQLEHYGRLASAAQRAEAFLRTIGKWQD